MANLAKILLVGSVMAFTSISPTQAQTRPGSVDVATGTWRVMNPSTFRPTAADVLEQFDRVAVRDSRLTLEKRRLLGEMLQAGKGSVTMVPDEGTVLDYLTGRRGGQPYVWTSMRKMLGRDDRALRFELGDGITVLWFTGENTSCNNIGVVIKSLTPYTAAPPPPIMVQEDRLTPIPSPMIGGQPVMLQGFLQQNCCCLMFTPGFIVPGPNHIPQQPAMIRGLKQQ